ncbi:lysophospholipase [Clostridia bacterium]|nr:lysophospholipase [Clostridia bacterium]
MKKTIVFQGDSITDAGRLSDPEGLGNGYVRKVAERLKAEKKNAVYDNRGISGNRAADLVNRWERDALALKPDIVTIMIGVNDVWRKFDAANDPTSDADFEKSYVQILKACKKIEAKIIMLQPYILRCGVVTPAWEAEFAGKKAVCDQLAAEYADGYVRTADIFDGLTKTQRPETFAADGVHPDAAGQDVIADALTAELKKFL